MNQLFNMTLFLFVVTAVQKHLLMRRMPIKYILKTESDFKFCTTSNYYRMFTPLANLFYLFMVFLLNDYFTLPKNTLNLDMAIALNSQPLSLFCQNYQQ